MRKNLVLLFGGQSTEHEVSCRSVLTVKRAVREDKYKVLCIGITKSGEWIPVEKEEAIEDGSWKDKKERAMILPDAKLSSVLFLGEKGESRLEKVDLVFPVLHGKDGEDGTIQGLLEIARIPYVGCGVLSSAISMDKVYTKMAVEKPLAKIGVRQAKYVAFVRSQWENQEKVLFKVENALSYPVFVKPSNAGSSCGVSKAKDRSSLIKAIEKALLVDRRVLVEESIIGRELECAAFSGKEAVVETSSVGEILAAAEFYDYDAKYNNPDSKTELHPDISKDVEDKIKRAAEAVFLAVDGFSLSRVDFFLSGEEVIFNEINTMPGFTSISMYPMLFKEKGYPIEELVEKLLESAFHRP